MQVAWLSSLSMQNVFVQPKAPLPNALRPCWLFLLIRRSDLGLITLQQSSMGLVTEAYFHQCSWTKTKQTYGLDRILILSKHKGNISVKDWKCPISLSETQLKQFAAMTPHPLLLDHSMALVCDQ
jgi:hypothetical protein